MRITMVWRNVFGAGLLAALLGGVAIPVHVSAGPREVLNECASYLCELKETYQRYRDGEATYKEVERIERIKRRVQWGAFLASCVAAYYVGRWSRISCRSPEPCMIGNSLCSVKAIVDKGGVVQIRVAQQRGHTCGYEAAKNARYIAIALSQGRNDLSQLVMQTFDDSWRRKIEEYRASYPRHSGEWLASEEIAELFTEVTGPETFIINDTYDGEIKNPEQVGVEGAASFISFSGLSVVIQVFKDDDSRVALPIIINTGGHWIVDVIYKKRREEGSYSYQHVIADSKNWYQVNDSTVQRVVATEQSL